MPLGSLIAAGSNLIGGLLGRSAHKEAQQREDARYAAETARQKEFAQSGIQWKVEDARKAGIHPIYALGAPTHSPSPIALSGGPDTSMASAMSSMGQDVSRAINATRSGDQRAKAIADTMAQLGLERAGLENDLLRSQIAKISATPNPPMPWPPSNTVIPGQGDTLVPQANTFEDRPRLVNNSTPIPTNPMSSNAEDAEKWGGEILGNIVGAENAWWSLGRMPGAVRWIVDQAKRDIGQELSIARRNYNRYRRWSDSHRNPYRR